MLQHRVEDGAGDRVRTEDVTTPNVMAALSNRIEKFVFDADVEMGFSRWYSRYKEVFTEDARQLSESARQLFDFKASEFTTKYQCLKLEKSVNEDYLTYTGSDITLLDENVWKKMGSPQLEKTNVTVKNASGDRMKIRGRLKCAVEMKDTKSVGYAYVTPYNSLMGLGWIQNNEDMLHHMKMMVAEINTKSSSYVEEELKRKYPEVLSEGLGLCTKEKADLTLLPDAQPVFYRSHPVAYAARESIEIKLDGLQEMGVITPVNHSEWANLKREGGLKPNEGVVQADTC
ncbi:hypothetical protein GCK32_010053 [Trichostrongylus colubriformis]|uniref:DUF7083 domain-containing protein n=1 Tax=Trichostrongylus colubriformis TaxID=6319 RepID=A0AAN8EMR1_TRICO